MRLGVRLGPFYASTSTRRWRRRGSSGRAWVLAFALVVIFWPLLLGQKQGGGYQAWVWLIAVPWWILCILGLIGIATKKGGTTSEKSRATPEKATVSPGASFPEPAPYVYYRVTAVRAKTFDLVSDNGEAWDGIESEANQIAKLDVGGRFTWDGENLANYISASMQPEIREQVARLNGMPAHQRIQMRTAATVQTMREFGYVFDANNKVVPVTT
jgi:hypothetical protein